MNAIAMLMACGAHQKPEGVGEPPGSVILQPESVWRPQDTLEDTPPTETVETEA